MPLTLTEDERAALEAAQNQSRRVRHWRRYRAVVVRANGVSVAEAARALGCSAASVYHWTAAWRAEGVAGRTSRRVVHGVVHGARNVATGELVTLVRERSRQDDCAAFVEALGQMRPDVPKLLVWENAPPHHPKRVQAAAQAANLTLAFLPFRAPELMACEDLWRLGKAVVAANRVYATVQEQAERAVAWLAALSPVDRLLKSGLFGLTFQWLST